MGCRSEGCGRGRRELLFQRADPLQRGGEETPHHRVVVGRVQQDRGLLLEERARVRAQGVGRGQGVRRWHRRAFSWSGCLREPVLLV